MPRAKKPRAGASIVRSVVAVSLSDDLKSKLLELVGIDDSDMKDNIIMLVEESLGAYPGWVKTMDNAPTHASVVAALEPIQREADSLRCKLSSLDGVSQFELESARFFERPKLIHHLVMLEGAIRGICDKQVESRGGTPRKALRHLVIYLGDIYCRYAARPDQSARLNFICDIMDAESITYPDDSWLQRMLPNLT